MTEGPLRNLDDDCPACQRPVGDHTMREFSACLNTPAHDLPYEPVPDDLQGILRRQFSLDPDVIVVDTVTVRSTGLTGVMGGTELVMPGLLHEFQVGVPGAAPTVMVKVLYISTTDLIRKYGQLVLDSANGAADKIDSGWRP